MAEPGTPLTFSVSELTLSILDGFMTAAALHLGEAAPDGRLLESPNPLEAWLALKSAGALMDQLAPVISEDVRVPLHARLTYLFERLEGMVPKTEPETVRKPVASLEGVARDAWQSLMQGEAPVSSSHPPVPQVPGTSLPGTGLPRRGSGLLFPPRQGR